MTVTVTGVGNYTGTASNKATIEALDITDAANKVTVEVDVEDKAYTGSDVKTTVTLAREIGTDEEGEPILVNLVEGKDYIVKYTDNKEVGTASLTVEGIGNYKGTTDVYKFAIKNQAKRLTINGVKSKMTYTGEAIVQDITVKCDGVELPVSEYSVKYENNTNAGTATIIVTCDGNYVGTATKTFKIVPQDLVEIDEAGNGNVEVEVATADAYNGKAQEPAVTVTNSDGVVLNEDRDYTIVYQNNVNAGTAKVTVTGIGNYTGTIVKEFDIAGKALLKDDVEITVPRSCIYW